MTFKERLSSLQGTTPLMVSATLFHDIDELKRTSLEAFRDDCEKAKVYPTWNYHEQQGFLVLEIDGLIESMKVSKPP
jgi:hypothetical protein